MVGGGGADKKGPRVGDGGTIKRVKQKLGSERARVTGVHRHNHHRFGGLLFFLAQTKMSWRSLLTSQYSR